MNRKDNTLEGIGAIPVICATIATIGKYFKTTVDMSRHKGQ